MATEPADFAKTPSEIYTLASRSEQVTEAAKLLEYALREYSGDFRSGLTDLYNSNRQVFEKDLRNRIRAAFQVRAKVRNVAKYGEPEFEEKTSAAETFIGAAQVLFTKYSKIYPEKFLMAAPPVADEEFFEKGFERPTSEPSAFDNVRSAATERELDETNLVRRAQSDRDSDEELPKAESLDDEDEFEIPDYQLPSPKKFFEPRLKIKQLEKICHRMGRSLKAGISITKAWETEARSLQGNLGNAFRDVLHAISSGDTLAQSVSSHDCFPPMFCEMVRVGEETGRLDRAFLRLADHYRNLVQMRRTFLSGITWPAFQFCAAIGVISFFFILLAILEAWMPSTFEAPDIFMLGFGPIGNLFIFWTLLGLFGATLFVAIKGISSGWFGEAPMRLALRIPLIGNTIKTMSLSRFAWSFGMAIESGMDAQRAIRLGVRSTNSQYYMAHEDQIADSVGQGNDFYTSLDQTDAFPEDLLQAVEVGEMTGEITESLERLSDDYREQTENSLRRISQISGFLVSMFIAIIIIFFIVLMYMKYIGTLNDAISNPMGAMQQYESGETKKKSSNPVTAAKNKMVNQIMESEDMQKYKKLMEGAAKADTLHGHDFLDALLEPFEEKNR